MQEFNTIPSYVVQKKAERPEYKRVVLNISFPEKLSRIFDRVFKSETRRGVRPRILISANGDPAHFFQINSVQNFEKFLKSNIPKELLSTPVKFSFATDPPIFIQELAGESTLFTCILNPNIDGYSNLIIQITIPKNDRDVFSSIIDSKENILADSEERDLNEKDMTLLPEIEKKIASNGSTEKTEFQSPDVVVNPSMNEVKSDMSKDAEKEQFDLQFVPSHLIKELDDASELGYFPLNEAEEFEEIKELFAKSSWLVVVTSSDVAPSEIRISNQWRSLKGSLDQIPFFTRLNPGENFFVAFDRNQKNVIYIQRLKSLEDISLRKKLGRIISRLVHPEKNEESSELIKAGDPIRIEFFDETGIREFHQRQRRS